MNATITRNKNTDKAPRGRVVGRRIMPAERTMTAVAARKPLYSHLYFQVVTAIIIGILLGYFYPKVGE